MARLLVFGGRDYTDRRHLFDILDAFDRIECIDVIIEGEATGADTLARKWAEARGVPVHPFPAAWADIRRPGAVIRRRRDGVLYDAAAGAERNRRMLIEGRPTHAIGFPGGSGTKNMATQAIEMGLFPRFVQPST